MKHIMEQEAQSDFYSSDMTCPRAFIFLWVWSLNNQFFNFTYVKQNV